ncbi:hypothetical protein ABZS66_56590 [Dactylosporangium sp. NPDC005572]|uniref:hypothetical protein n=1 Tax=Dactylosporangium sp. NPDC005572 TaxID=3156889 RepID=UPI0033ACCDB7
MKLRPIVVAAIVAVVVVAAPGAASAHPGLPLNVFDPVSTSWASVRDATEAEFHDAVDARVGQNMIMIDLEADSATGGPRFGGVFQRNSDDRRWIVDVTLTEDELEAGPVDQWDPELRLVDVEVYLNRDGVRTFAALWVENLEGYGWTAAHDLTGAQAQDLYEAQRRDRLPIDVDRYTVGGAVRYAMIWLDNPGGLAWRLHLDQSSAQFATSFDAYSDDGFRLLMVDSAGQRYASIWLDNTSGRQWRERRDLTSAQYATWWDAYARDGFRLITYERYDTAAGTRYVGVWRQN